MKMGNFQLIFLRILTLIFTRCKFVSYLRGIETGIAAPIFLDNAGLYRTYPENLK